MGLYAFLDERFQIGKFSLFELINPNGCRWTREGLVSSRYRYQQACGEVESSPYLSPAAWLGNEAKRSGCFGKGASL